jgi:hypothetical protein
MHAIAGIIYGYGIFLKQIPINFLLTKISY